MVLIARGAHCVVCFSLCRSVASVPASLLRWPTSAVLVTLLLVCESVVVVVCGVCFKFQGVLQRKNESQFLEISLLLDSRLPRPPQRSIG
jgi:hypothetical protein